MAKAPDSRPRRVCATAILGLAAGMFCAALAIFISTNEWVEWMRHPAVQRPAEVAERAATLLRIMLGVAAVSLAGASIWLCGLQGFLRDRGGVGGDATVGDRQRAKRQAALVIALLVVAVAFRLARMTESLWYDEIAMWLSYGSGVERAGAIVGNYFDPVNHIFHTLLTWWSVNLLEDRLGAEIAMRLPAFLFSLASVAAIFGLCRGMLGGRAALIAGILAAALPVMALEGAEARGYSMMIFFSIASTWALIEGMKSQKAGAWIIYALLCAAGAWAHLFTAFVPIGHAAWLAWGGARGRFAWRELLPAVIALALSAVLTITLHAPIVFDLLRARSLFDQDSAHQPGIFGIEGLHTLLQLGGSWSWWAAVPGLVLGVVGVSGSALSRKRRVLHSSELGPVDLIALMMLGLAMMIGVVSVTGSWMYARFALFSVPGAIVLIALGIDALWSVRRAAGLAGIGVVIACAVADLALRPPKQPLREAADFVRAHRQNNDSLLVIGLAHEVMRAYAGDLNLTYSFWHGRDLEQELRSSLPQWIVIEYPHRVPAARYDMLRRQNFEQAAHFDGWVDWGRGDIEIWRRR